MNKHIPNAVFLGMLNEESRKSEKKSDKIICRNT